MGSNLRRSLFIPVAVLGLFAVTAVTNANQADAKSYARVTSNRKMATDPTTRNVTFTGGNALYTKAGTLRGARLVASKATLSTLANSSSSSDNFRAYRIARTNRGSIYYKVVSFDQQYRGWIYGGRSTADFGGGVRQFATFNQTSLSDAQRNSLYKIASPGIANDGKTVTYQQPAWTQYKVGRQILDSTPYANASFKVVQVGTRTREGDQWVQIQATDNQYSQANGWILYSGLTLTQTPIADNAVRVNLVDASNNNNVIKTFDYAKTGAQKGSRLGTQNGTNWTLTANDKTALQNQINTTLNGTGYYVGILNQSQINALAQGSFGSSVNVAVSKQTPIADNAVRINLVTPDGTLLKSVDYQKANAAKGSTVGSWNGSAWVLANDDNTSITNLLNNALTGTGYYLTNAQLSTAQQQALAAGRFGDNVTLTVSDVKQTLSSRITPYATSSIWQWTPALFANQLSASNSKNVTSEVTLDGNKYTAQTLQDVYNKGSQDANWQNLEDWLIQNPSAVSDANQTFKNEALTKYMAPANMNFGPGSGTFTNNQLITYVKGNSSLATLSSPQYPIIATNSGNKPVSITFGNTITYTARSADGGTYGNDVKVYYTYPQ
ncbi:hypothetical protein [Lentilactobacillus farraginis]|uniref:Surface layer protein SlpB n=1 Tax=Lentilactobacillus farraginis DSM 18382 = JCM 14108 TaxID=1423743 RepID=X0QHM6_9LACO|nr:hypothetical protein [Lentilactobacillus farraginis]GAF38105.1 hypothetical protein JCM14108_3208 [Lentilactobacillus farraginis DSM 18382 = JCM 14108]